MNSTLHQLQCEIASSLLRTRRHTDPAPPALTSRQVDHSADHRAPAPHLLQHRNRHQCPPGQAHSHPRQTHPHPPHLSIRRHSLRILPHRPRSSSHGCPSANVRIHSPAPTSPKPPPNISFVSTCSSPKRKLSSALPANVPTTHVLGPLNIDQWRKFHLVHGEHHLKQIAAIRKACNVSPAATRTEADSRIS